MPDRRGFLMLYSALSVFPLLDGLRIPRGVFWDVFTLEEELIRSIMTHQVDLK